MCRPALDRILAQGMHVKVPSPNTNFRSSQPTSLPIRCIPAGHEHSRCAHWWSGGSIVPLPATFCGHATLGCYASVHELPTNLVLHRCLRNASCPRPKCPHTHQTHAASASRDLSGLRPGELGELRQFNFNGTHRILAKKRLLQCSAGDQGGRCLLQPGALVGEAIKHSHLRPGSAVPDAMFADSPRPQTKLDALAPLHASNRVHGCFTSVSVSISYRQASHVSDQRPFKRRVFLQRVIHQ